MRHFSSTYSFFNFRNKALILACLFAMVACAKHSQHDSVETGEATGKGNGGNNLHISEKSVHELFGTLKPKLQIVMEGLEMLTRAETISPGSSDLSKNPNLIVTLKTMFSDAKRSALVDLQTPDNLILQDSPCVDFRGVQNAAAALLGDEGGPICFSTQKIQGASIKNFYKSSEIFLIALAAHEFVHHFVQTGTRDGDELAAQEVQNFVEQQLARQLELNDKEVISIDDDQYLQQFRNGAKDLVDNVLPGVPTLGSGTVP